MVLSMKTPSALKKKTLSDVQFIFALLGKLMLGYKNNSNCCNVLYFVIYWTGDAVCKILSCFFQEEQPCWRFVKRVSVLRRREIH